MNSIIKIIRDPLLSINLSNNPAELVYNFMKTKTVKRIYIKMLKFKMKQDEHVNKMKLNKRFSKKIQTAEDLDGIIVTGNVAVALPWNGNSETCKKEAELNTFWFSEKIDWQV